MTPKELLERMTGIGDEFILSAAEEKSYKRSTAKYVKIAASLAACLGIAVGSIALGVHYMRQEPPDAPVTTDSGTESAETETEAPGTDTGEAPKYNEEDFVIDEDGRLLAYTGDDTEVYIPETVTEITADAFEENEAAEDIIKVHISSSVRYIDEKAFAKLSSVEEFEVDEDNKEYVSENGIVATKDGTLYFSPSVNSADITEFEKTLNFVLAQKKECTVQVAVGLGKVNLDVIQSKDGKEYFACITSVIAFNETYSLGDGISLRDTANVAFLQTWDTFMLYRGDELGGLNTAGTTWVFTEFGMYKLTVSPEEYVWEKAPYNRTILVPTGEIRDGKFGYALFPEKYRYDELEWSKFLVYCLDPEEFAREEGYMYFKNGEILLEPTATYTATELFSIEPLLTRAKEPENFEYFKAYYHWKEDYDFFDVLESNNERLVPYDRENAEVDTNFTIAFESRIIEDFENNTITILEPESFLGEKFEHLVERMVCDCEKYEDISCIVIGDTKMRIRMEIGKAGYYDKDPESLKGSIYLLSIESHGYTHSYVDDLGMAARIGFCHDGGLAHYFCDVFMTDEAFVFLWRSPSTGSQSVVMFTDEGISDANTAEIENYDDTKAYYTYQYAYDDLNKRITYRRTASKYFVMQTNTQPIDKCVARDEFYRETGYISFDDEYQIIYIPEDTSVISDIIDLDKRYEEIKEQFEEYKQEVSEEEWQKWYDAELGVYAFCGIPLFDTLDECLAYNATIYERAY